MPAGGSVSFDRAAGYYDATRLTDDAALDRILDRCSSGSCRVGASRSVSGRGSWPFRSRRAASP